MLSSPWTLRGQKHHKQAELLFLPEAGGQPLRFVVSQSPPDGKRSLLSCEKWSWQERLDAPQGLQ